jgi:glycosyl transferase, family 25
VLIISMPDDLARRDHIKREFSGKAVDFAFLDAMSGNDGAVYLAALGINVDDASLTSGEIGCLASHISAWKIGAALGEDSVAVFEDDVYLGSNARYYLESTAWIPQGVDIVKTEIMFDKVHMSRSSCSVHDRLLRLLLEDHWGAAGYILTRKGANGLLGFISDRRIDVAVDHLIFDVFRLSGIMPVYQMAPALCIQEKTLRDAPDLKSRIEVERNTRELNRRLEAALTKRHGSLARITREGKRTLRRLHAPVRWLRKILYQQPLHFR